MLGLQTRRRQSGFDVFFGAISVNGGDEVASSDGLTMVGELSNRGEEAGLSPFLVDGGRNLIVGDGSWLALLVEMVGLQRGRRSRAVAPCTFVSLV